MRAATSALIEICVALLLLQGVACEDPAPAGDATDKPAATANEWAFVVHLKFDFVSADEKEMSKVCAGSVVGESHVLTAAACATNKENVEASNVTIRYGNPEHDKASTASVDNSSFAFYERSKDFGLLVIKVDKAIGAKVNWSEVATKDGTEGKTVGWALASAAPSASVKAEPMKTMPFAECKDFAAEGASDKLLCAKYSTAEVKCAGDLGGPLVSADKTVLGVLVSHGKECGEHEFFSDSATANDWLTKQTAPEVEEATTAPGSASAATLSWALLAGLGLTVLLGAE